MPSQAKPPESRTAYVLARLREELAEGFIGPGDALKQTVIAKRYGVSATPVREALRILAADGAIQYDTHRGASVRELDARDVADLYLLRASVEAIATYMAVQRMDETGIGAVKDAAQQLAEAAAAEQASTVLSDLNRQFHFAIYQQSSPIIEGFIDSLWSRFPSSVTIWTDDTNIATLRQDHDRIVQAVEDRDAPGAAKLMSSHVLDALDMRTEHVHSELPIVDLGVTRRKNRRSKRTPAATG